MNIRRLFKTKVETLELCDAGYLEKTLNQFSYLNKKQRDKMKEQIVWFLRMKDMKQSQTKFNEIAGRLNDYQMQNKIDYVYE